MRLRSIAGWKAKSKFASVCPVGRFDSRSAVFTRRDSRPEISAPSSTSRNSCAGTGLRTASASKRVELLGGMQAAKLGEPLARAVDVELLARGVHRATSSEPGVQIEGAMHHRFLRQLEQPLPDPAQRRGRDDALGGRAFVMRGIDQQPLRGVPRMHRDDRVVGQDLHGARTAAHLHRRGRHGRRARCTAGPRS